MNTQADHVASLSLRHIARTWWPLALSWLLMSVEGPAHSAIVARLINPEINLAAWGGIVFPISLVVESPIVMMLSASTALSADWPSYRKLRRVMMGLGALLTGLHVAIAFTPLYDVIVRGLINAPEAIIEPGRIGMRIMTPWSWTIAYRRFQQGAMIRFGHTGAVGVGTVVRMVANGLVLLAGYLIKDIPGIVVASGAVATGVTIEAIYAGLRARPIVRNQIRTAPRKEAPFTMRGFLDFYVPLALTSLISFFVSPLSSAAMSRMPQALSSLAAWPVVNGLIFMLRSPGMAYNEVVVATLDRRGALVQLRRFAKILTLASTAVIVVVAATPLSNLWLDDVMALPPHLLELAQAALYLALLLPGIAVLLSWYQGVIVNSHRTRGVTESVLMYIIVIGSVMGAGVFMQGPAGLYVAVAALEIAGAVQVAWLWHRSRPAVHALVAKATAERLGPPAPVPAE
ncbi:MAG: hypothetical protein ACP5JG_08365 [Anaerolineae bacterium]